MKGTMGTKAKTRGNEGHGLCVIPGLIALITFREKYLGYHNRSSVSPQRFKMGFCFKAGKGLSSSKVYLPVADDGLRHGESAYETEHMKLDPIESEMLFSYGVAFLLSQTFDTCICSFCFQDRVACCSSGISLCFWKLFCSDFQCIPW